MDTVNAKQVLSNLYGLMMEINYHQSDEDVLSVQQQSQDPQLVKHLVRIKQLTAKSKAHNTRLRFQQAIEQIAMLKEKGLDELKKLVAPHEQAQFIPLFRKFEGLTKEDESSILEDQQLLKLIQLLKDKLNDDSKQ